jgi:hypothetical protein
MRQGLDPSVLRAGGGKITLIKEPNKLAAARAGLERAAEDLGDPDRLGYLRDAINSLLQLMSGVSPQIEKDIAKKLVLTHRNKVLSEAKVILANFESHEPAYLEHWNKVMEVFVDASLEEQLLARRGSQSMDNTKPAHVDILKKKELQAASPQNDFYFRKNKEVRTMLHAKSLSAIGQSLEMLRLRAFGLEKKGDFYIVRSESLTETHEWILRNNLAEQILDSPVPDPEGTQITVGDGWLCYGPLDIARLHARELKKRDNHGFEHRCEADKLAQLLGTLGEHLDSKKATAFEISWAPDSVSVEYQTPNGVRERKDFTVEKLQQLASYSRFQRPSRSDSIGSR